MKSGRLGASVIFFAALAAFFIPCQRHAFAPGLSIGREDVRDALREQGLEDIHIDEAIKINNASSIKAVAGKNIEVRGTAPAFNDLSRLNRTQANALRVVEEVAKTESAKSEMALLLKFREEGLGRDDLNTVLKYVEERAPITINFNPDLLIEDKTILDGLIATGRYWNQYQSGMTGAPGPIGSNHDRKNTLRRDRAEKALYGGLYHAHPLDGEERPKYGALNIGNSTGGGAAGYGLAYIVLAKHVKDRATFTADDSLDAYADISSLGTSRAFKHVLDQYIELHRWRASAAFEAEIRAALPGQKYTPPVVYLAKDFVKMARGEVNGIEIRPYLEAQIHGPIELDKDVEKLVAASQYADTLTGDKLRLFSRKFGVPLFWNDGKTLRQDERAFSSSRVVE